MISDAISSREVGIEVGGRGGATMSEKTEASDCSVHSIIAALKSARQRALPSVANRINRGSEMEFRFCMGICSVKRADSRAKTLVAIQ